MKSLIIIAAISLSLCNTTASFAQNSLEQDFAICINGTSAIENSVIEASCTRLIDESAVENELVGFFHGIRAGVSSDPAQICLDAQKVIELVKDDNLIKMSNGLIAENC